MAPWGQSDRPTGTNRHGWACRPLAGDKVVAHYNRGVSRFYSLDDADAMVPEIALVVERLRVMRDEVAALRDRYRLHESAAGAATAPAPEDPEFARLRLRIRGLVDQMQADAAWLDEREIVLRDISTGLLDFPALVAGRPVWLCWRSGETAVAAWHPHDEGFSGRRPISELPGPPALS